ncbi:MAG: hypothetical protein HC834_10920, partial [Rhodospirillales bacterium]|nr:hypothetical protein [Rhodospirillales bacterium]
IEVNDLAAADPANLGPGRFADLRRVSSRLPPADAAVLAYARGLMYWHRRHRYCGSCGTRTISRDAGHALICGIRIAKPAIFRAPTRRYRSLTRAVPMVVPASSPARRTGRVG